MIETISHWKKKVWKVYSLFIRLKDADKRGYNFCVTCDKKYHYKKLQAGHFVPGRNNIILFNEDLTHPQCWSCNIYLYGNPRKYDAYMRKRYGDEKVAEFDKLGKGSGKNPKQFTIQELKELYEYYKNKSDELLNQKIKVGNN